MPEGPQDGPARRGRRQPQIAEAIANDDGSLLDDAGEQSVETPALFAGDVIACKASHSIEIDGRESWFTYGIQTHVGVGEDEFDAFERAVGIVNTRVLQMAEDAYQRIQEYQAEQRALQASQPIRPQRR